MSGNKNKLFAKIASAFNMAVTEDEAETLLLDTELSKALSVEHISDSSDELHHSVPSKEEIKVGPVQEASGGGAERMIGQYSATTMQRGITLNAEHLGELLGNLAMVGKAQTQAINKQIDALNNLAKAVEANREVDLDQAISVITSHAKSSVEEAVSKLDEASDLATKARTIKSSKTKKSVEATEQKLIKAASELLEEIRDAVSFINDDKLTSSFNQAAIKAEDVDVVDDEDEDDEKPKAKAKKAEDDDMDSGDGDKHEPKDAAKAEVVNLAHTRDLQAMHDKVTKALDGLGMLQTDVNGLMDAVRGQPKTNQTRPDIFATMKSNPNAMDTIGAKIENANLDANDFAIANNILAKTGFVNSGQLDSSVVARMIENAPAAVKSIFDHA